MPYQWFSPVDPAVDAGERLRLWPHSSLTRRGFALFVGATALLISVPLGTVLGTAALWVLLPFLVAAITGLWLALNRSWRDRDIVEILILRPDRIELARRGPGRRRQDWAANPYWVRLGLHPTGGPVPNYLTLAGDGREVEIGAFLTGEERLALHADLATRLARLR